MREGGRRDSSVEIPCLKGVLSMSDLYQTLVRFLRDEEGPTAVEYAVMLALIIVVCVTAIGTVGSKANATFDNAALKTALTTTASS
jgi:pilus assembly protein Flp/PilA